MDGPICKNCTHFCRHYTLSKDHCTAIDCGHCSYPRLKHRKANAAACIHYVCREKPPTIPKRKEVINYLTTDVLEYIMKLKLPPEVTEE